MGPTIYTVSGQEAGDASDIHNMVQRAERGYSYPFRYITVGDPVSEDHQYGIGGSVSGDIT